MSVRLAVPIAAVLALVAFPRVAECCTCAPPPPPEEALAQADAVFFAVVRSKEDPRPRDDGTLMSSDPVRYTMDVVAVWKGDIPAQTTILTAMDGASCGRSFEVGGSYVVFARGDQGGMLWDSLCSRTREARLACYETPMLGEPSVVYGAPFAERFESVCKKPFRPMPRTRAEEETQGQDRTDAAPDASAPPSTETPKGCNAGGTASPWVLLLLGWFARRRMPPSAQIRRRSSTPPTTTV